MLAAVLKSVDNLVLEDVPIPEPGLGEVVVRIKACGVCATDYKAIRGTRQNVTFPAILGHEPAGTVHTVGLGVTHLKEGDEVIIQPSGFCGVCDDCRAGKTHYCRNAFTTGGDGPTDVWPGSFAEYTKTRANCCFLKPPEISFDGACLTEPLSGAWKGVVDYSDTRVGDDVVIIGVGGIGLLCLMVARAAGAGRLIAIDLSDYALENARQLGATHVINPARDNPKETVYAVLPNGPDVVVEAAGPIQAVELTRDLLRRGTRWNVFGITTHETFELDGGLTHFLEARMDASFGTNPRAMLRAIRLLQTGLVDTEKIISHRFPLRDIHAAIEVMGTGERNKVVVNP
ncbi:MAG: alcohol dehydrogenase catalytic domain-containing protein [Lentisphaerae bacterium]|jgi:threonine dehydrogenase-like Zn-dependent dehydrogenase|nr:alcohol dehydrogenase catalytic domain-containing protein [Lentisphaerota bacterium]MBT4815156.1 alcohol dehydrogenase catalytic domain-containing protein [Lentisphaerota bacterium]MBT5604751.1 alcohol dehydrogenase catalytic domain-containing protein [Lentisphaerota bacterium]MBT7058075.1 alcohol dehydrogenase catalytic domain-containing protein [Lentisphaerota bacterium]MBT7841763.1 alcohol dehydrogenase catalytic domain-containing protein [Lentisphaerota bacterium]